MGAKKNFKQKLFGRLECTECSKPADEARTIEIELNVGLSHKAVGLLSVLFFPIFAKSSFGGSVNPKKYGLHTRMTEMLYSPTVYFILLIHGQHVMVMRTGLQST